MVHHDAVTEEQWVEDTLEIKQYICNQCGATFGQDGDAAGYHILISENGCYGYSYKVTQKATGHYKTETIQEAYDEPVSIGFICSECGATK